MRCPACGARNSPTADWCTQCYADLRPPPTAESAPTPDADADAGRGRVTEDRGTGPEDEPSRDVRSVEGEVEWRCGRCGTWSPLDAVTCVTCDGPRTGFGEANAAAREPSASREALVAASVVLPGLGHLLAGRTGSGAARLVLALSWALGAVAVTRAAGLLAAAPLLLGAGIMWVATVRDVLALHRGGPELLTPRVLAGLTAAVVGTLLVVLVAITTLAL